MADDTVADLAQLYLGNILYAIELAALSLQEQGRPDDAAFYRAIARKLAEARGREVAAPASGREQPHSSARAERPDR
jgi:hypothetical protein